MKKHVSRIFALALALAMALSVAASATSIVTRDLGNTKLTAGKSEKTEPFTAKNRCVKVYIQNDGPSDIYCYVTDDDGNVCGEATTVQSGKNDTPITFENADYTGGYTFHYQAASGGTNKATGWWSVKSAATWGALGD